MGLGRTAVRGAISTVFWQTNRVLVQLVSVVVLSRLIAPRDVGLVAMVVAIIGFGELLRDFGLSMAAVQAKSLSHDQKSNLFWINGVIGAFLAVVVFALGQPIAALYGEPELVIVAQWISLTFLFNGLATQFRAELNRQMRFSALSLSELVPQVIGLAVAIPLALKWANYQALVVQQITTSAMGLLFVVACARWWPAWPRRHVSVRALLRFGAGLMGTQSVAYFTKSLDNIALGYVWGPAVLGIYGRSYQLVVMPLAQFTAPLTRVAIPVLTRLVDDPVAFGRYLRAGQSAAAVFSCIVYGLIFGLAEPFVTMALGPRWIGMVPIIQALSIGGIFRALGQVSYWIFVVKGLTGQQFRFYLWTQPFIILCMLAGLPWAGLGVAVGHSVGYGLFWFVQLWWVGRVAGIDMRPLMTNGLTILAGIALPCIAIGLAATMLIASPWLQMAAGIAGVALYGGLVVLVVPAARRETTRLLELVRGRPALAA